MSKRAHSKEDQNKTSEMVGEKVGCVDMLVICGRRGGVRAGGFPPPARSPVAQRGTVPYLKGQNGCETTGS